LTDTRVIDDEGVYATGQENDRLRLGFKGTMREAALHWLRNRLLGGTLAKAPHSARRFRPPAGVVFAPAGQVVREPDEAAHQAVRLLCTLFAQSGSALAVVQHVAVPHRRFPSRGWGKRHGHERRWEPLAHTRVLEVRHHPTSAGTYVHGRTPTRSRVLLGAAPRVQGRTRRVARQDWPMVLHDQPPASSTWDQCRRHPQPWDDHRPLRPEDRPSAVREGAACVAHVGGACACATWRTERSRATTALRAMGARRARPVRHSVATAWTPPSRGSASTPCRPPGGRSRWPRWRRGRLRRGRVRARGISGYKTARARRRFLALDPDNRLVARTLERDWHDTLAALATLERAHAAVPPLTARLVSPEERQRILALAQDVPAVWAAETPSHPERMLLRCVIKDVPLTKRATTIAVARRWQTAACTLLDMPRPARSCDRRRPSPTVIARLWTLAPHHTDSQRATTLHHEGATPGLGGTFTASTVAWLRYAYAMPAGCPEAPGVCPDGQRGDGRYAARAVADLLHVDVGTIADWCRTGRLEYVQQTPYSPRWVTLTPEGIAALRKPVRQRKP